jgi:uncharacterized membrane protein
MNDPVEGIETQKAQFGRDAIAKEIEHRRDKLWKIFSWASALLVAITGGLIALKAKDKNFALTTIQFRLLLWSVIVLTGYACLWVKQNLDLEEYAQKVLDGYDNRLGIALIRPKQGRLYVRIRDWLGYIPTLILLSLGAIVTIYYS